MSGEVIKIGLRGHVIVINSDHLSSLENLKNRIHEYVSDVKEETVAEIYESLTNKQEEK